MQKEVDEYLWLDKYRPKNDKIAALVALRKLYRQSLRKRESISMTHKRINFTQMLPGLILAGDTPMDHLDRSP